jgi:hypothetical protein
MFVDATYAWHYGCHPEAHQQTAWQRKLDQWGDHKQLTDQSSQQIDQCNPK